MNTTKYLLSIAVLIGVFTGCTKEPFSEREYPRLQTYPVSHVSTTGATFNAGFIVRGSTTIYEYGFVWATVNNVYPTVSNTSDRVSYKGNVTESEFSTTIEANLIDGADYNVRAYIKTNEHLVYGNIMVFRSMGSDQGPEIISFHPQKAMQGDTIHISGKNFSYNRNITKVYFEKKEALVLGEPTDTLVRVKVPVKNQAESVDLKLDINGNTSIAPMKFQYLD
jgi:hypothetical protein